MAQDRFPCISGGERAGKSWEVSAIATPHIIALPYIRRDEFFHVDCIKRRCVCGGKREGSLRFDEKTSKPRNAHVMLFGPTYSEPRIEFQYIENWLSELGKLTKAVSKPQDGAWRMVTTDGVVIQTFSMEDPRSIRAVDLEFALVCEAGRCPYDGIERVQGRVSAKKGFILYSGTMEDAQQWWIDWMLMGRRDNHLGVKSYSIPTWTNRVEFPGGRNDSEILRLEKFYPEDIFLMRVAAEARPSRFRVLKEFTSDLVKEVDVPEDANWEIWVDYGYATAYALLFVAWWNNEDGEKVFHFADELYEQGKTTRDIHMICEANPIWPLVSMGVIDVAGRGHRDANESAIEIWEQLTSFKWEHRYWNESVQIERLRSSAKQNHFTISPNCRGLLAEAGLGEPVFPEMHVWKYATDRDGRILGEKPLDKWNHSSKAMAYGMLHHLGQVSYNRRSRTVNRLKFGNSKTKRDAAFSRAVA